MNVKFKKLAESAKIPTYATEGSCGLDLYCSKDITLSPGQRCAIPTDIAVQIPKGYFALVGGRSGWFVNDGIVGVTGYIDSDYRGGIGVMIHNTSPYTVSIKTGERCGQMVIVKYPTIELVEAEELSSTDRGSGGFGHTGKI